MPCRNLTIAFCLVSVNAVCTQFQVSNRRRQIGRATSTTRMSPVSPRLAIDQANHSGCLLQLEIDELWQFSQAPHRSKGKGRAVLTELDTNDFLQPQALSVAAAAARLESWELQECLNREFAQPRAQIVQVGNDLVITFSMADTSAGRTSPNVKATSLVAALTRSTAVTHLTIIKQRFCEYADSSHAFWAHRCPMIVRGLTSISSLHARTQGRAQLCGSLLTFAIGKRP
jgi:hypothetical protein